MIQQRSSSSQPFSVEGHHQQFWSGQDIVHPAFPLPAMASSTLQDTQGDGFGEAVVACDMPKPRKFTSLDRRKKRLLWAHKEVDLDPHPDIGLVLQPGNEEKFPHALGLKNLDPFLRVSKQGPCLTAIEEDRDDERLAQLAWKADGVAVLVFKIGT